MAGSLKYMARCTIDRVEGGKTKKEWGKKDMQGIKLMDNRINILPEGGSTKRKEENSKGRSPGDPLNEDCPPKTKRSPHKGPNGAQREVGQLISHILNSN